MRREVVGAWGDAGEAEDAVACGLGFCRCALCWLRLRWSDQLNADSGEWAAGVVRRGCLLRAAPALAAACCAGGAGLAAGCALGLRRRGLRMGCGARRKGAKREERCGGYPEACWEWFHCIASALPFLRAGSKV